MRYKITITFDADRKLTGEERFQIAGSCHAIVALPVDGKGKKLKVTVADVKTNIEQC